MHEAHELMDTRNGDHPQVSRFFAVRLEEIEKEVREDREKLIPRHPFPSSSLQRQTARPQRLYTYD